MRSGEVTEALERLEWQLVAAFKENDFRRARRLLKRRLALVPLMAPLAPADQAKLDSLPGLLDEAERHLMRLRRGALSTHDYSFLPDSAAFIVRIVK